MNLPEAVRSYVHPGIRRIYLPQVDASFIPEVRTLKERLAETNDAYHAECAKHLQTQDELERMRGYVKNITTSWSTMSIQSLVRRVRALILPGMEMVEAPAEDLQAASRPEVSEESNFTDDRRNEQGNRHEVTVDGTPLLTTSSSPIIQSTLVGPTYAPHHYMLDVRTLTCQVVYLRLLDHQLLPYHPTKAMTKFLSLMVLRLTLVHEWLTRTGLVVQEALIKPIGGIEEVPMGMYDDSVVIYALIIR